MKNKFKILLLILGLIFFVSGCSLIEIIKPKPPIDDPIKVELFEMSYVEFLNDSMSSNLGSVQFKSNFSRKDEENFIKVQAHEHYRFNFMVHDDKIISTENIYNFTTTKKILFEIHYSRVDEAKIILVDEDNTYLASITKKIGSDLNFSETLVFLPKLNVPQGSEFSNWDINLPSKITEDIIIKPIYQMENYPYDAKIELSSEVKKEGNSLIYQGNVEYSEELKVIERGMIFLESNYFIDDLTINNVEATIVKDDNLNNHSFSLQYDITKEDVLNVRAYMIVQGLSGRQEVVYSDNIIKPFIYADDLFFSYYIEGNSYNKALAIFNGTGRNIDLSEYKLLRYSNGGTTSKEIKLSGVVPHGESFIIIHSSYALGTLKEDIEKGIVYGTISGDLNHNGDDGYELYNKDQLLDRIGTLGVNHMFGADVSYKRSPDVTSGNITNWTDSDKFTFDNGEWISVGFEKFDGITKHQMKLMGYTPSYNINIYNQSIVELNYFTHSLIQDGIIADIDLLMRSFNHPNVKFVWKSSDKNVFTDDGKYLRPISDAVITIEVEMILNGEPLGVVKTFEVKVASYQEPVEVFNVELKNGTPDDWISTSTIPGMLFMPNTYIKSSEFSITRPSTLSISTISSEGKIKVLGLNKDNEEVTSYTVEISNTKDEYRLTFLYTNISFIKFIYIEGSIVFDTVVLTEGKKDGENDFTPPVIMVEMPTRISKGSQLDMDSCTAIDDFDGELSCRVIYNDIDTNVVGLYKIIFEAQDAAGNIRTLEIYIEIYTLSSYMALDVDPSEVLVKFIDIGKYYTNDSEQGESTYIKIGEIDILIDAGMPYANTHNAIKEVLDKNVTGKLDYIIATHPHQDHIGGLPFVLKNYDVGMAIIYSTNKKPNKTMNDFMSSLENEPGLQYCEINDNIKGNANKDYCVNEYQLAPNVSIKFYDTGFLDTSDDNASSIVLSLKAFGTTILLNGDAESKQEANYAPKVGKVNIFKMGHHGSRNGTSDFLLTHLDPEIAIISNGTMLGNKHGHPTFEAINRVYKYNSKINIYVTTGGGSAEDSCRMDGASYKCSIVNPQHNRNGTITVSINTRGYSLASEYYGNNILELSLTDFWKNHPNRQYSHG